MMTESKLVSQKSPRDHTTSGENPDFVLDFIVIQLMSFI